ncbi:MAG: hypothetical protein FWE18_04885 [Alphaproteobacteria bacterium]|nr:hypothetical protein [Alphaproteobacteria bacterium]
MNFLKKIFLNSAYKELCQKIFPGENKLKYSLAGFSNFNNNNFSDKNFNFLILNRENNRNSTGRSGSTRNSSNRGSSSSASSRYASPSKAPESREDNSSPKPTSNRTYTGRNAGEDYELEGSLNKHKQVRLPSFSIRNEVKDAYKNRQKTGDGLNGNIRSLVEQNRKHRSEQAIRLQSARGVDTEETESYIQALSKTVDGKGIVNNQLKVLAFMIFALIVMMFMIGTFLNQANPLVPILASINKPLSIKIVDSRDAKIFETKREPRTLTYAANISSNFEHAFIALHALNELIYQKAKEQASVERIPVENVKVDQDFINFLILEYRNYINAPRESIFRRNTSIFGTISDVATAIPNKFLDWANNLFMGQSDINIGFEMQNEFAPSDQPLLPNDRIDTYYLTEVAGANNEIFSRNDFYIINGCKIFKGPEDMASPNCEFSSINIIMTKFYQPDTTGFVARYINPIKNYLLVNWLKEKVSLGNFFELLLNVTYFSNYQIGMKASFINYFEKVDPNTMDVPHALFMLKLLYDNNKKYYPNYEITVENILDMMIANDYVPEDLRENILDEYKKASSNAKIPRTSFSIYLDSLFLSGYEHFPESYDITVKTTFSNALQNALSSLLGEQLRRNNIPEGSAIVIQNNQLLVGLTTTMVDGKLYFKNTYPETFVYNSLKPWMYLTLLDNKKDVPTQILDSNYQNLIFSNKRIEQFVPPIVNPNLTFNTTEVKMTVSELQTIESKDLAVMPSGIRKMLAEKLTYLENNFFSALTAKEFEDMFNRLRITPTAPIAMPDLLNGDVRVNFFDITRSYTAFQAEPSIIETQIIDNINGINESKYDMKTLITLRRTYTELLKNVYFNTITTNRGNTFFIMMDFQSAIIFNDEYIIALWLGDINGDKKFKDTTESLEVLVGNVMNLLQQ